MIFYPSESLILGLFLMAAIMLIIAAASNIAKAFSLPLYHKALTAVYIRNVWIARVFLFLALAAGISSSLLPIDGCGL